MKKYVTTIIVFLFCGCITIPKLIGQAPGAMTYQAEVRDTEGKILKDEYLDVTIDILEGSIGTTPVLTYTYSVTTDKYGLFTVTIGNPTDPYDPLYGLDWETEPHYLKVQVTDDKYNTYDLGTSQFLSVPYALHARTAETAIIDNVNDADSDPSNELQDWTSLPGIPTEITDGDDVDDADASSINELQNLTLEDDILKLSLTNDEVSLDKYASHWKLWGDDLLQFTGAIDIGDNYSSGDVLRVDGNITVGKRGENVGTWGISGPSPESGLGLAGGKLGGGQIYLYGPEHISHPGEVRLRTGGYARILINPDGNVGIRTSTPNYDLDVSGDINFTGELLYNGSPFTTNDADADPGNELQDLAISDHELSITSGNSIILPDEVDDADADPGNELITEAVMNGSNLEITDAGGTKTVDLGSLEGDFSDGGDAAGMDRTLGNTSDHALSLLTNNANRLHIKNTGEIGIGTTIPSEMLEVTGKIYSKTGGFKFPDGTVQVTASTSGGGASRIDDLTDGKTSFYSVYLGANAGANDDGSVNRFSTAIGYDALSDITTGRWNTTMGWGALTSNTEGSYNVGIGSQVLESNTTGNSNVSIGREANRYNVGGSQNTIVGDRAGRGSGSHSKSGNVFLGYNAGYYETGSNLLYIENSTSPLPLIWGDFSQDKVKINGSMEVTSSFKAWQIQLASGAHNGYVLTSDASGNGSWQSIPSSPWTVTGYDMYRLLGNVGIGTNEPIFKLDVNGNVRIDGSVRADKLIIPATEQYYSIAGCTFNPTTSYSDARSINYIAIHANTAWGDADLVAPVHIPSGATLENISAKVLDNGPGTITVSLYVISYNGGKFNLGSTNSSINSSSVQNLTGSLSSTVDNNNNALVAVVRCYGTYNISEYYRIYKVKIRYSISALP